MSEPKNTQTFFDPNGGWVDKQLFKATSWAQKHIGCVFICGFVCICICIIVIPIIVITFTEIHKSTVLNNTTAKQWEQSLADDFTKKMQNNEENLPFDIIKDIYPETFPYTGKVLDVTVNLADKESYVGADLKNITSTNVKCVVDCGKRYGHYFVQKQYLGSFARKDMRITFSFTYSDKGRFVNVYDVEIISKEQEDSIKTTLQLSSKL
jgi:hypothetical protein